MKLTFYNESMETLLFFSLSTSTILPNSFEKYLFLPSILETNICAGGTSSTPLPHVQTIFVRVPMVLKIFVSNRMQKRHLPIPIDYEET